MDRFVFDFETPTAEQDETRQHVNAIVEKMTGAGINAEVSEAPRGEKICFTINAEVLTEQHTVFLKEFIEKIKEKHGGG